MKIRNVSVKGASLCVGVSVFALSTVIAAPVYAQDTDEVIVTGIRQSLKDAMGYKRDSDGVVDAINAEDIGKFPNTNLAESLQRIPGVSIDRVNGEGAAITVRGFGPSFNQVTLNGRSMPTADVPIVGAGLSGDASGATGRAFDFSNLATDGVRALEVYKTGRADISSGGIGATVNVVTGRPLDNPGLQAAFSAKAIADTTVDRGRDMTPELGGTVSWTNENETFGVGVFGSYSERDSAAAGANSASWVVTDYDDFLGLTTASTNIVNAPADGSTLITLPRDSRYQFSEFSRERLNGQVVAQFAPTDALRLTADYTFAVNKGREDKAELSNWFNRPFTDVTFSSDPVPTTVFLREASSNQAAAMQQTLRQTKDELSSFGFNGEWDVKDNLTIVLDAHKSSAEVTPNTPLGFTEINVGIDEKYSDQNDPNDITYSTAVDYSGVIPIQIIETTTGIANVTTADAASQVSNLATVRQKNDIDQVDLHMEWQVDDSSNLTFGANYRSQENITDKQSFRQILGNWGAENRNDIDQLAPGALETYCLSCRFESVNIGGAAPLGGQPSGDVIGLRGNAADIFSALSPVYASANGFDGIAGTSDDARVVNTRANTFDAITEDVISFYTQFDTEFEVGGRDVQINAGLRYEKTDVSSLTTSVPTAQVVWQGNNDFDTLAASSSDGQTLEASYNNLLPNLDIGLDLTEDMKLRASYSKTIARATYNRLFASNSVNAPTGPLGLANSNVPTGNKGNPGLLPLESDNFDISYEWYFDDASYISIGAFEKRVRNFVGDETVQENLFGLRDASSGAPGTRSGTALAIIDALGIARNEDNFFAATVYVDQAGGDMAAAMATFQANQGADGNIDPNVYLGLETNEDVFPDAADPLLIFNLTQPINNREAKINGIEIQGQHFFGDTGFGIAGSYTFVNGDVGFDLLGDKDVTQFALEGLSDTANATLIYEKGKFNGRLAYNWRDDFLQSANDGNNNPIFVEAYGQIDLSLGYDVTDNLSLSFEGINLNEESSRTYQRSRSAMRFFRENGARYYVGARYKF